MHHHWVSILGQPHFHTFQKCNTCINNDNNYLFTLSFYNIAFVYKLITVLFTVNNMTITSPKNERHFHTHRSKYWLVATFFWKFSWQIKFCNWTTTLILCSCDWTATIIRNVHTLVVNFNFVWFKFKNYTATKISFHKKVTESPVYSMHILSSLWQEEGHNPATGRLDTVVK